MAWLFLGYSEIAALAITLGFAPPLLWLWFWLKEDVHPEPRREIIIVFSIGMAAVIIAFVIQYLVASTSALFRGTFNPGGAFAKFLGVFVFAFIEEAAKTGAAFVTALRSKYFDEPVDAMIYLVTAALGFAALENILFVSESLRIGIDHSIRVSAFRFANAVLIHVSSAAIIGASFAFSFCHRERRIKELTVALFLASVLHALYNFFILRGVVGESLSQLYATLLVAGGAGIAVFLFERARRLKECTVVEQKSLS